jgi:hypothetical protein
VKPISLFTMGMRMISELMVYETGRIKRASVQTPAQLVSRHVYTWDPLRKKIPAERRDSPII